MKSDDGIEIYIHVPFCRRKCGYCDFVSFVTDVGTQDRYFDMLIKEIKNKAESVGKLPVDSVFFGGGTPSVPDSRHIAEVMDTLRDCFLIKDDAEITTEANPNSVTKEKLSDLVRAGFNRVSIGLQSADNEELKTLTRIHTFEDFLKAYGLVRDAGIGNVNIDLMSAIPGQTIGSYEKTLNTVMGLKPEHISAYSLILEENTPFYEKYRDGSGLPSEDEERSMYYLTGSLLAEHGYKRYEISNYALEGRECRHNIGYWTGKPYLGFGVAAASYYNEERHTNGSDLKKYLDGDLSGEDITLTQKDMMEEFMFLGLRLIKGVSRQEFIKRFKTEPEKIYGQALSKLTKEGLLIADDRIRLTARGLDLANYCMAEFMLD